VREGWSKGVMKRGRGGEDGMRGGMSSISLIKSVIYV